MQRSQSCFLVENVEVSACFKPSGLLKVSTLIFLQSSQRECSVCEAISIRCLFLNFEGELDQLKRSHSCTISGAGWKELFLAKKFFFGNVAPLRRLQSIW